MHILEFKEEEHFTLNEFHNMLINIKDKFETTYILEQLELAHCLNHYIPSRDLNETIDEYELQINEKEYYKFTFIGIIVLGNYCFIVYPKYWKSVSQGHNKKEKFNTILNVIQKYNKNKNYNIGYAYGENKNNYITVAIKLLKEYILNGLYFNEQSVYEVNGEGEIMWDSTINDHTAYIYEDTLYYLDFVTQSKTINNEDLLRRLHAAIITDIYINLKNMLYYIDLDYNFNISYEKITDFGPPEYLIYIIERELSLQFISEKQEILKNMKNYIQNKYSNYDSNLQIYGTTVFNMIWEEVCSTVYKNNLNDELKSLELLFDKSEKTETNKLKDIVEKPLWTINQIDIFAKGTLKLDVLSVDKEYKTLRIFDAKYYLINYKKGRNDTFEIYGQPGVNDIVKQYLYQLAYTDFATKNGYKFSNCFVFPMDDLIETDLPENLGKGQILGTVKMNMLSSLNLTDITLIGRDCQTIFNEYLKL